MAKAGKTDEEIIQEIKVRRTYYRLSAKDIIYLHDNGVSNRVIDFMLETEQEAIRDEQRRYDERGPHPDARSTSRTVNGAAPFGAISNESPQCPTITSAGEARR